MSLVFSNPPDCVLSQYVVEKLNEKTLLMISWFFVAENIICVSMNSGSNYSRRDTRRLLICIETFRNGRSGLIIAPRICYV